MEKKSALHNLSPPEPTNDNIQSSKFKFFSNVRGVVLYIEPTDALMICQMWYKLSLYKLSHVLKILSGLFLYPGHIPSLHFLISY